MKMVTMLEFRKDAEKIIRQVERGQSMVLTYRGRPAIRLEPVQEEYDEDDPFFKLIGVAEDGGGLTNEEIDAIVYREP